jgi:hypothetical protein
VNHSAPFKTAMREAFEAINAHRIAPENIPLAVNILDRMRRRKDVVHFPRPPKRDE